MNPIAKPLYAWSLKGIEKREAREDKIRWFRVEFEIVQGYTVGRKASILLVSAEGHKSASPNRQYSRKYCWVPSRAQGKMKYDVE